MHLYNGHGKHSTPSPAFGRRRAAPPESSELGGRARFRLASSVWTGSRCVLLTPFAREGIIVRALVTGASGFIGGHIVEALRTAGHEPVALVRPTSDTSLLARLGASGSPSETSPTPTRSGTLATALTA